MLRKKSFFAVLLIVGASVLFGSLLPISHSQSQTIPPIPSDRIYLPFISFSVPTATATLLPTNTPLPTATNAPLPTETSTPVPTPTATTEMLYVCSSDTYNCSDFNTQSESQTVFNYCVDLGFGDIHRLDRDNNGVACESLP